jgi:hypothetical protein
MDFWCNSTQWATFTLPFVWGYTARITATGPYTNWLALHTLAHHTVSWSPYLSVHVYLPMYFAGENITSFFGLIRETNRTTFTFHFNTI